jgi:Ni,Fe-hydrogenase maturation factor
MEIVIIGVEPKEINYGLEPTEQVSRKVPEIINRILEEF